MRDDLYGRATSPLLRCRQSSLSCVVDFGVLASLAGAAVYFTVMMMVTTRGRMLML